MLTNEENLVYQKYKNKELDISRFIYRLSEAYDAMLAGFPEHTIKSEESLDEKLHRRSNTCDIKDVHDILRYTIVIDKEQYTEKVKDILSMLSQDASMLQVYKLKNYWDNRKPSYKGINCQIVMPGNIYFELQFHTVESLANKEVNHELYELCRTKDPDSQLTKTYNKKTEQATVLVENPENVLDIKDIEENRDIYFPVRNGPQYIR
jgi:ppGpp synthetase/RelA/SpoT-type nucleotidyltranferase